MIQLLLFLGYVFAHNAIGLLIFSDKKRMRADVVKAIPQVKPQRLFVLLPHTEPNIILVAIGSDLERAFQLISAVSRVLTVF